MKLLGKYVGDQVLGVAKGTTWTAPSTLYVGASTAQPTDRAGTGIAEPTTGGYARQPISSTAWNAIATSGSGTTSLEQITNTNLITFPVASASWGTILGLVLYDALSGGNFWAYGDLPQSQAIGVNQQLTVPATDLPFQV